MAIAWIVAHGKSATSLIKSHRLINFLLALITSASFLLRMSGVGTIACRREGYDYNVSTFHRMRVNRIERTSALSVLVGSIHRLTIALSNLLLSRRWKKDSEKPNLDSSASPCPLENVV
jgi:hypothetical protein